MRVSIPGRSPAAVSKVQVPAGGSAVSPFARQEALPGEGVYFGATRREPVDLRSRIDAGRERGRPLPSPEREHFEPRLGTDLSRVRLHTGAPAAKLARDFKVPALTVGRDVFFGSQAYQPGTETGRRILVHELAHAAQQAEAPAGAEPEVGHPGDRFEDEARQIEAALASPEGDAPSPVRMKTAVPRVQAYSPAQDQGVGDFVEDVDYAYNNHRPESILAPIALEKGGRHPADQTAVSRLFNAFTNNGSFFGQKVSFAAGHLIADQFGADGNVKDLVPMETNFNGGGGAYGKFENQHVKTYLQDREDFMDSGSVEILLDAYWNVEFGAGLPDEAADDAFMGIDVHYGNNRHGDLLNGFSTGAIQHADPNLTLTVKRMANQIPDQLTCAKFGDPFEDFFTYLDRLPGSEYEQFRIAGQMGVSLYKNDLNKSVRTIRQAVGAANGDTTVQNLALYLTNQLAPQLYNPMAFNYKMLGNQLLDNLVQLILPRIPGPLAFPAHQTNILQGNAIAFLKTVSAQDVANQLHQPLQRTQEFRKLQKRINRSAHKAKGLLTSLHDVPLELQNKDALGGKQTGNIQFNPLNINLLFQAFLRGGSSIAPDPRYGI